MSGRPTRAAARRRLKVRALTAGVGSHVAVEVFDERGVSALVEAVAVP